MVLILLFSFLLSHGCQKRLPTIKATAVFEVHVRLGCFWAMQCSSTPFFPHLNQPCSTKVEEIDLKTNFYFLRLSPDSVLLRHDHLEEPFSKQTVAHTKQSNPMILLHVGHCDRLLQDSAQMILSFSFTVSGE